MSSSVGVWSTVLYSECDPQEFAKLMTAATHLRREEQLHVFLTVQFSSFVNLLIQLE